MILGIAFAIASIGGVAANASNATMTPPHKATQAELEAAKKSIQTIGTKFGEFERTNVDITVSAHQVVTDLDYVNEDTLTIVTDYGTFVKK